jgi:hypothetical protein
MTGLGVDDRFGSILREDSGASRGGRSAPEPQRITAQDITHQLEEPSWP